MRTAPLLIGLLLAGCAATPPVKTPGTYSFIAIGDHGYDLRHLDPEDTDPPMTPADFIAEERKDWAKDKRPTAEFKAGPYTIVQPSRGAVAASGMMSVSNAMRRWCETKACQFGVMLGDNIYPDGADGIDDSARFRDIFTEPYGRFAKLSPDFRLYATLGNHDWHTSREGALAQAAWLKANKPFYMDGFIYRVSPPETKGEVEIFVLDTHLLLNGGKVMEDALADDGSEISSADYEQPGAWEKPVTALEKAQAAWLSQALKSSTARWKIVIGHHPLWASAGSKYRQSEALRAAILPVLCEDADMYLAGHEHTLEAFTDACETALPGKAVKPLPAIVSGAAGKQRPLNTAFMRFQLAKAKGLKQLHAQGMVWGAAHLTLAPETATITFITTPDDASGMPVATGSYSFARRSGK